MKVNRLNWGWSSLPLQVRIPHCLTSMFKLDLGYKHQNSSYSSRVFRELSPHQRLSYEHVSAFLNRNTSTQSKRRIFVSILSVELHLLHNNYNYPRKRLVLKSVLIPATHSLIFLIRILYLLLTAPNMVPFVDYAHSSAQWFEVEAPFSNSTLGACRDTGGVL